MQIEVKEKCRLVTTEVISMNKKQTNNNKQQLGKQNQSVKKFHIGLISTTILSNKVRLFQINPHYFKLIRIILSKLMQFMVKSNQAFVFDSFEQ